MEHYSFTKLFFTRAGAYKGLLALVGLCVLCSAVGLAAQKHNTSSPAGASAVTPDLNSAKALDRLGALEADKKTRKISEKTLKDRLKNESDPRVRHRLNQALALSQASDTALVLMQSLQSDSDPAVRQGAAQLLGNYVQNSAVVNALAQSLEKESVPSVRYACALSLGLSNSFRALNALEKTIADPDANLRRQIAFSLKQLNTKRAQTLLKQLSRDKDPSVRAMAKDGQP